MGRGKEPDNKKAGHPDEKIFWFVALGFIAMVIAPAAYIIAFFDYEAGGPGEWGNFATYFSGIVTPVVALCSAVLFFRSIVVQRREFEETRREMRAANALQLSVENNRASINKQQQLERTIPRARKNQSESYKEVFECWKKLEQGVYDSSTLKVFKRDLSKNSPKPLTDIERRELKAPLLHHFKIGKHVICMLHQYLDIGGDIYIQLDVIIEMTQELEDLRPIINDRNLEFKELPQFLDYDDEMKKLAQRSKTEISDYVAKRTKEPQSA